MQHPWSQLQSSQQIHTLSRHQQLQKTRLQPYRQIQSRRASNSVTDVFLSSSGGSADLQCVNPGGNDPPPKRVDFGPLQGQTVTVQPRNGQITATPSIGPPPLPSASDICPNPNWSLRIVSLTYEDVVLNIQQNGEDILTFNFGNVDP